VVTAAELVVKVGWDDTDVDAGAARTGDKMGKLGGLLATGAAAIGTGAVAAGGATIGAMMKMEDAMTPIGTLVGTQSEQFKALSDGIKDMVRNSPDDPAELGNSAYAILSAGITDTEMALKALNDATDLAGAGMGTTAQATDLITSAMNSFKGENLSSEQAAKLFYGTIASGKTTTAGLAQGFGAIAPLAASAGVSFKDLMAATAALTATGMPASQAYSGIKGALTGVIKPTAEAAENAKRLGIDMSQAHLAAVGLPAFLDEVKTATGGNIEEMAGLFGSVEGLNTVLALTGSQADAFANNLTNVASAGENMAQRAAETDQTLSARFQTMKNKVMVALSDLGNKGFKWLSDFWAEHGDKIIAVASAVGAGFVTVAEAAKPLVGVFTAVFGFLGDHIELVAGFAAALLMAYVPSLIATITTTWALVTAKLALAAAWVLANAQVLILAAAIGILIGAVIWAYKNWEWFRVAVNAVKDFIVNELVPAFQAIWAFIKDKLIPVIVDIISWLADKLKPVFQGIADFITNIAVPAFSALWSFIKDKVIPAVADLVTGIVGFVSDAKAKFDEIVGFISGLPGRISSAAAGMFDGIKNAFRSAVNFIIDAWNRLEFKIPGFDPPGPGPSFPGFTLGVPDIPRLAFGGDITRAGWAVVGDRGPEFAWLNQGAQVRPGTGGNASGLGGQTIININVPFGGSVAEEIVRELVKYNRLKGDIPITVRAA
jgi:TP901 family phage tail tape measure protein